jgi:hypothetical protein
MVIPIRQRVHPPFDRLGLIYSLSVKLTPSNTCPIANFKSTLSNSMTKSGMTGRRPEVSTLSSGDFSIHETSGDGFLPPKAEKL